MQRFQLFIIFTFLFLIFECSKEANPSGQSISIDAPTKLKTSIEEKDAVLLTWKDESDNEEGFIIERMKKNRSFSEISKIGKNNSSYSDTTVVENTTYIYRVCAYEDDNLSDYSNQDTITYINPDTTEIDTTEIDTTEIDTTEIDTTEIDTTEIDTTEIDTTEIDTTEIDSSETNKPPEKSESIFPTSGQTDIDTSFVLKWECSDDDGDSLFFILYLDTVTPPSDIIEKDLIYDTFEITDLIHNTTYYWRVKATDKKDTSTSPIFSFSTIEKKKNIPPEKPDAIYPTGGQSNIDTSFVLKWETSDEDGDPILYSIYFDTTTPPVLLITGTLEADSLLISGLDFDKTYYWKVVATDGIDSTNSSVFSFSTRELEWEEIIPDLRKKCYIIGFEFEDHIIGLGSGFAVSPKLIMTNAHVVEGLIEIVENYGMDGIKIVGVRDGGLINESYSFELDSFAIHSEYDTSTNYTYDFGLLTVSSGTIKDTVIYESVENLLELQVGDEVATIGFPGETNSLNTVQPIATYKSGTISALRPFNPDEVQASPSTNVVLQHNFNTTGGTSGSPVFNKKGNVIAIHNSGEYEFIQTETGWTRIPVGSLGYSIRIDQRTTIMSSMRTAFKDIEPQYVYYTFINGTLADMQMYINGNLADTIGWLDTLILWDYKGAPVNDIIEFYSIVATDNGLYWRDTLITGTDFKMKYIVTDDYFLLGITNNTNKIMTSCVVSNEFEYDSSAVYLGIGNYTDVGYYKPSISTTFHLHFLNASEYIFWEDIDTRSTTGEAKYVPLEATLTLAKRSNFLSVNQSKNKTTGKKETFYRKTYKRNKLIN